ncbi:unnamed protein product [Plutella xylostella]|uniref:(diamondback moth) hypothetical protein n=1 Tax=Plutella xylostella TaxID=51655 RepID=A0A8S4FZ61_PLUXY|nr:unnamed protein product [Plutella xylostella]
MLGARLKSWMEAQLGRAKKRKQKPRSPPAPLDTAPPPHLSSPESAYSTGYSTDGTSPGAPRLLSHLRRRQRRRPRIFIMSRLRKAPTLYTIDLSKIVEHAI